MGNNTHIEDYNEMQLCIVWLNCGMYTEYHHCSLKGDFPSPAIHINPLLQSLNVKVRVMIAVQRAYVCVHAHILVHVIECAELLTSSRGGALMSSVPWKRPTPHVQGDWFCPVPWHTSASDGLTGPWRRTSSLLCLFFTVYVSVDKHQTYNSLQKFCIWLSLHHL